MIKNKFKPLLIPNNKGKKIDWNERIKHPEDWLISLKKDGARLEITKDSVKGRSLKPILNKQIVRMAKTVQKYIDNTVTIEGEFYSHEMNFSEIMHFFRTNDVTSKKTKEKYEKLWEKTQGNVLKGWKFPGRSVEWLTTWHDSLKFYFFDTFHLDTPDMVASYRLASALTYSNLSSNYETTKISQFNSIDTILKYYENAINNGYEGLVLQHKDSIYKFGRATLNENTIYKMKEDNLEYDAVIVDIVQATEVDPDVPTKRNELGRTVTSKKKDDRDLIESISGFKVIMDDDTSLKVSLRGWDSDAKVKAFNERTKYVGQWIIFTGMKPVKEGGKPRHPQFKCFRDSK